MFKKSAENLSENPPSVYFCPYCRVILDRSDSFRTEKKNKIWYYRCVEKKCGRFFDEKTFKKEEKNGKHYYTKDKKIDPDKLIEDIIIELYQGYPSYRKVAELSHFSRKRVENVIQKRRVVSKVYKLSEFFDEVLKVDRSFRKKYPIETVIKMLEFGFSKNQIKTLLNIDYYSLEDLISGYIVEDKVKHKVKVSEKKISYSYFIVKT